MALKKCINCIHCEQGEGCSFCSVKNPFNKDYAEYVYPPTYSCPKFKEGESESRKKYMEANK